MIYTKDITTNITSDVIDEILDTCYLEFNQLPDLFCNLNCKNHIHAFNCLIESSRIKTTLKLNDNLSTLKTASYPVIELRPLHIGHWHTSGWLGSSSSSSSSLPIHLPSDSIITNDTTNSNSNNDNIIKNEDMSYYENIKLNVICDKDLMLRLMDIQKPNTGDIITYYREDELVIKTSDLFKTLGYLAFNGPFVKHHEFQMINKRGNFTHAQNSVLIEVQGHKYKEEVYKKSLKSNIRNKGHNNEEYKENDSTMTHLIRQRINGTFDAYLKKLRDYPFEWYNIDDDIIGSGSVSISHMKSGSSSSSGSHISFSIIDDASSRKLLKNAAYLTIRWFLVFGYIIVVLAMPKVLGWSIN